MRDENANDEMDELIRRSTQVEIPVDVESRLRRRLVEFRIPPRGWTMVPTMLS